MGIKAEEANRIRNLVRQHSPFKVNDQGLVSRCRFTLNKTVLLREPQEAYRPQILLRCSVRGGGGRGTSRGTPTSSYPGQGGYPIVSWPVGYPILSWPGGTPFSPNLRVPYSVLTWGTHPLLVLATPSCPSQGRHPDVCAPDRDWGPPTWEWGIPIWNGVPPRKGPQTRHLGTSWKGHGQWKHHGIVNRETSVRTVPSPSFGCGR